MKPFSPWFLLDFTCVYRDLEQFGAQKPVSFENFSQTAIWKNNDKVGIFATLSRREVETSHQNRRPNSTSRRRQTHRIPVCRPGQIECPLNRHTSRFFAISRLQERRSSRGKWWAVTGSNRWPSRCKRDALPTELTAQQTIKDDLIYTALINIKSLQHSLKERLL